MSVFARKDRQRPAQTDEDVLKKFSYRNMLVSQMNENALLKEKRKLEQ